VLAVIAMLAGIAWWRWGLAGLAIACGIALVGGLLVWAVVMPSRLAPPLRAPDLAGVGGKDRLEAIDHRTRLHHDLRYGPLQLLTVLAAFAAAVVAFQQLAQDRDRAREDRQLTRQGQASQRFTRAIDQLADKRVETRIGGIYGLDQIAEQAPENTGPVGEVLLAWLNGRPRPRTPPDTRLSEHAPDVQAALSVLTGQPRYASIVDRLNLQGMGLRQADLENANLRGANLRNAILFNVHLNDADLHGADLGSANLGWANLDAADLHEANLYGADLENAGLHDANLRDADLRDADLHGADLRDADLHGARADAATVWPRGFDWRQAGAVVP
jgi:hypothetical protein